MFDGADNTHDRIKPDNTHPRETSPTIKKRLNKTTAHYHSPLAATASRSPPQHFLALPTAARCRPTRDPPQHPWQAALHIP
jgi:hypothetical protein